jgi:BON domain
MGHFHRFRKVSAAVLLSAGILWSNVSHAQTKPAAMPDAQIEANVLKALAGAPELADQSITSTTVYGVVTLNGTVRDEPSRDLAEHLVASTTGVQKVVDRMVVSSSPAAVSSDSQQGASNPSLQSDGTMAPPQGGAQTSPPPSQNPAPPSQYPAAPSQYPAPASQYPAASPQGGQYPQTYPSQPGGRYPQPYPAQAGQYPQPYPAQPGLYPQAYPAQPGLYPPQTGQAYPPAYQPPYVPQKGGDAVVIPSGTILRVRINQALSSNNAVTGSTFDGVVLSNIYAGNQIAIPRGATFQGVVADAHSAGQLSGRGELKLQLANVTFGGMTYPIATDLWWGQGPDKTGNTVGNTIGLAGLGAVIGGIAGGGVGAAVGAGVGGVAGLGVSSASKVGEASLPSEAIVTFHLTQPADVTTVSQAELNRLGAGIPQAPQQMNRRYPPPPPGYGYPYPYPYYGPGYAYPR